MTRQQFPMNPRAAAPVARGNPATRWLLMGYLLIFGVWLLGLCWLGGCNIIGAAAYVVGPPDVKPVYVPEKTPMLVLAEDYATPGSASLAAEQLERHVIAELQTHDIAPPADGEKVYELRVANPAKFRSMSITALGRLAAASQVLYISTHVDTGDVAAGAGVLRGQGGAVVRIVDVASGETLWPVNESRGYPVMYETRFIQQQPGVDPSSVQRRIQESLADQIVKLFYKHKPDEYPAD